MVPSSVSVVYTPTNTEVARLVTCTMPHGSRVDPSGAHQYSTCMMDDQLVEIDRNQWAITRRFKTGRGPYNLAVTPDGKLLIAFLKQGHEVQIFDLATGANVMQAKSSTTLTHGVAVSHDSRYAFVSCEGVGAAPGKVDVYDLRALTRVASVDVGQQASGIAFWKQEPAAR